MIAELGHFALILAFVTALLGLFVPHGAIWFFERRQDPRFLKLADRLAIAQFLLALTAFLALMQLFLSSDFSVKLVAAHSHSAKPLLYKISGVWGNHEGSLLLWVLILSFFSALIAVFGQNLPILFRARVLGVQSFVAFGFLLFILVTSNPFERLVPAVLEGNGLNPLLQDPGLAFHPPMLYLGYVGLSVSFSFAIAALIEGEVGPLWARYVRPWTLLAWIFLTGGIALGSWWAYYELGWGGWWFWDPVENASFMPWLAATALLHSAIVVEKRDSLKSWTILLAIIAFSFSLLGTFLVRSGVLTSVHAFASDPTRGLFILAFLTLVIGGSLSLYAFRARRLAPSGLFVPVSREGALVLNNILLASFALAVLTGTLYPLILEASAGEQISVGPPFFNFAALLLMAPLLMALGFGPLLAWKRARLGQAFIFLLPALGFALLLGLVFLWQTAGHFLLSFVGLSLSVWLFVAAIIDLYRRLWGGRGARFKLRLRAVGLAGFGMAFAHMGVAFVTLGVSLSESLTQEALVSLRPGESENLAGYQFKLEGVKPVLGENYSAVRAEFSVSKNQKPIAKLYPEDRVYTHPPQETTEAAIAPFFWGDLYAVIGQGLDDGRWSVRLYIKPAISGLWFGAILMMLGGVLSLLDRRLRLGTPAKNTRAKKMQTLVPERPKAL